MPFITKAQDNESTKPKGIFTAKDTKGAKEGKNHSSPQKPQGAPRTRAEKNRTNPARDSILDRRGQLRAISSAGFGLVESGIGGTEHGMGRCFSCPGVYAEADGNGLVLA